MRRVVLLVALALALSLPAPHRAIVRASACDWSPSSGCPAPGVGPGAPSYPCYPGQIKGDRNSMTYHLPGQGSYQGTGGGSFANTWCFSAEEEAQSLGFRRSS
jgi:hypothetical protein